MMRLALACSLASLCACSVSPDGRCKADSDCAAPAVCLTTRNPAVCVVPQGACFPTCGPGLACVSGACVSSVCSPACPSSQQCDTSSVTCKDVTQASIAVTSPAAGAFAGPLLQATATARAPGGVNGVRFELRGADGTVLASATANAPSGDPANFAAQLSLGGAPQGAAKLFAIIDTSSGPLASSAVDVTVDLTPPVLAMVSDGRAGFLGPANATAAVVVTAVDPAAGIDPASVQLSLLGGSNKSFRGTPGASNQFSFAVPIADLGVAAGTTGSVPFKVTAGDAVGNAGSLAGAPAEVVQVDLVKPIVSVATDGAVWHAAGETVTVAGAASDSQSGLAGGAAAVSLASSSPAGNFTAAGSLSGGAYTVQVDLSALHFAGSFEGPLAYTITVTDAAGNAQTATSSLSIDNAPPRISAITQPAGEATANGRAFFRATGNALAIGATIVDGGSGVDPSSVTLQIMGGGSGALTTVAGTRGAGDGWSFALPRSVGRGSDGSSPVQFLVTAKDKLGHSATSEVQSIFFDDAPPVVTAVSDSNWYARTTSGGHVLIAVHETIADAGAGLASASLTVADANSGGALTTAPGSCTPQGDCAFTLDAAFLAAGSEGRLQFTINAQDKLSQAPGDAHQATASDFRQVDGKPPAVTITRVANTALPTAETSGVAFPAAIANTGYDGAHFVYSDTLTITGTIQDSGAGIDAANAPPTLEVDGQPVDGAKGPRIAISGCTDGTTQVCSFTATVKLNDRAQAGAFHAADAAMQVVVNAADKAVDAAKAPAGNATSSPAVQFAVTRLWWRQPIGTGASNLNGIALMPSGGLVVTTQAAAGDNVFGLKHDGPLSPGGATAWHKGANFYGAGVDLGPLDGAPSIGTHGAIYLATRGRDVAALDSNGSILWNCGGGRLGVFHNTPTVATVPSLNGAACEAVFAGADNRLLYGVCQQGASCVDISTSVGAAVSSPVTVFDGTFFVGASTQLGQATIDPSTGTFNPADTFTAASANLWTQIVSDASQLYAANPAAANSALLAFTAANHDVWTNSAIPTAIQGQPIVRAGSGGLVFTTGDSKLHLVATPSGSDSAIATLTAPGLTPLLGQDGRIYTAADTALLAINAEPATPDWSIDAGTGFTVAPTMACDGTLYAAAGATVYAFVTDARGLANTPWPKYQRDTRNSGNADAATLWGANVNGVCVQ
jgi:hypothetical protein